METFLTVTSQRKRPRSPTEPVQPDNPAIHKDPDVHYENREDWDHEEQVPPPTDPLHPQQQDQLAATTSCSGTSAAPLRTVMIHCPHFLHPALCRAPLQNIQILLVSDSQTQRLTL